LVLLSISSKTEGLPIILRIYSNSLFTVISTACVRPELWRKKEFSAVKDYLYYDIIRPLELAEAIEKNNGILWTSKSGKSQFLKTKLLTVLEAINSKITEPRTDWMENPPKRKDFFKWMSKDVLEKYGVKI